MAPPVEHAAAGDGVGVGHDQVLGHGHVEHAPGVVAVLGDDADAGARPWPRLGRWARPTPSTSTVPLVELDEADSTSASARCPLPSTPATPTISPGVHRRATGRRAAGRPSWPRTDGAVDAQHRRTGALAADVDRPRRATSSAPSIVASERRARRPPPRSETGRPTIARASVRASASAAWPLLDDPPVAHDRDLVGGVEDLVELVADERDGAALVGDHARGAPRTAARSPPASAPRSARRRRGSSGRGAGT